MGSTDQEHQTVAGAEEYAAKITKIQQACLRPLKEDLADWLNSIMKISYITTDNFMDKLDNGVIICRLAKIISQWCDQQLAYSNVPSSPTIQQSVLSLTNNLNLVASRQESNANDINSSDQLPQQYQYQHQIQHQQQHKPPEVCSTPSSKTNSSQNYQTQQPTIHPNHQQSLLAQQQLRVPYKLSASSSDVYSPSAEQSVTQLGNFENTSAPQARLRESCVTPTRNPQVRPFAQSINGSLRSSVTSQSTNCLSNSFLTNSIVTSPAAIANLREALSNMNQIKIWEDAKCRTFYARDNVCNFIKWSKEFGVNRSVLFESDDLVLHANPRQVILCLLDVARIACVRYGFTEAPGLVKFEQEFGRELAAEKALETHKAHARQVCLDSNSNRGQTELNHSSDKMASHLDEFPSDNALHGRRFLSLAANGALNGSVADATDDLIMRYCMHKEEEAAKKKAAEMEAAAIAEAEAASLKANQESLDAKEGALVVSTTSDDSLVNCTASGLAMTDSNNMRSEVAEQMNITGCDGSLELKLKGEGNLSTSNADKAIIDGVKRADDLLMKSPSSDTPSNKNNRDLMYDTRVDSLDSGEGRTESASTSHSRTPINSLGEAGRKHETSSSIPVPITRSDSSSSLTSNHTSSMGTSELSSSRSSLLSGQDSNSTNTTAAKRHVAASDLDGKVMRIAKSYYGKGVTKGVKRLSEGKYKIADRIVFVRLLKGHRVMVRIGGGWDTLENFLFRHKSDPSQVIDVDNLLPLETKMSFDKTHGTAPQGITPSQSGSNNSSTISTPTIHGNKFSRLPFYQRSNSASSTNLSTSNLSNSNQSPTPSCATSTNNIALSPSASSTGVPSLVSPLRQSTSTRRYSNAPTPYLLIHRGQNNRQLISRISHASEQSQAKDRTTVSSSTDRSSYTRPLGSSKTPTASSTNLYPATLTTRMTGAANMKFSKSRLSSTSDLHTNAVRNVSNSLASSRRSEMLGKLGRSSESLQTSHNNSAMRPNHFKGAVQNETYGYNRQPQTAQRTSARGLVRQVNSVNI